MAQILARLRPGFVAALTGALMLAACDRGPDAPTSPRPQPAPEGLAPPSEAPTPSQAELRQARAERNRQANNQSASAVPSDLSDAQRQYYASVEAKLLSRGKLRRDRAPLDAPIDADTLARNFMAIALHDEYSPTADGLVAKGRDAPLRRWSQPVRIQPAFGTSNGAGEQAVWRSELAQMAGTLSQATGHPVSMSGGGGNFVVLVMTEDERRAASARIAELVPGIPARDIGVLTGLPASISCTVFAYSRGGAADYAHAIAVIRAELPPLLRTSCIHEELAQGMGLSNDSPAARPSVFNDDEEFALLTRHDELLLKILYDPRLRPGMSEAEAAPIVRRIAAELLAREA
ncbi:DUF2927 domain-containing protein [Paracoccus sp. 1_MG-2023]|uniref:DUF2927 domain-containing protein n=1 Tax=unclassified Paracoccus (in: a-proteobacteria) TaxID=2688777 RepID=UPI001C0A4BD7|nr:MULTISPECIES: DUF2927 domain-containing protein [unclassified Paracoccus (in: a-proteobacteria)]MBU2958098.1 DUF2927 domain-containing protein [Paracoccus sp. C2R09]MDO6669316.1 DUF2927 domain-containing protein [Paracoccus sp. 1_MG-2023]